MRTIAMALLVPLFLVGCKNDAPATDAPGETGATTLAPTDLNAIVTDERPSKRSEIMAAGHPATNSVVIFGGNDGPIVNQFPEATFRADTWVFEPGHGWTKVAPADKPSKRGRYTTAVDHDGSRALLFGGRFRPDGQSGDYTLYNDLWAFDFVTREWSLIDDGSGDAPAPRYYAASAWDASSGTFYVWGGTTNTSALIYEPNEELWAWDGSGWTEVPTTGDAPSLRTFVGSTHDPARNRLLVFGGQKGDFSSLAYNDFYALDLETHTWEKLHGGNGTAPSTRMFARMVYDEADDRYLLFGGHTDVGDMNDLWAWPAEGDAWEELYIADAFTGVALGCAGNSSEVPADYVTMDLSAPERREKGMVAEMHGNLWIFGGMHAECSDHLDDTWRFDLGEGAWHELLEARSGEACERRNDDCDCLCL